MADHTPGLFFVPLASASRFIKAWMDFFISSFFLQTFNMFTFKCGGKCSNLSLIVSKIQLKMHLRDTVLVS